MRFLCPEAANGNTTIWQYTIPRPTLLKQLALHRFSAVGDHRPALYGVTFFAERDALVAVAADGAWLVERRTAAMRDTNPHMAHWDNVMLGVQLDRDASADALLFLKEHEAERLTISLEMETWPEFNDAAQNVLAWSDCKQNTTQHKRLLCIQAGASLLRYAATCVLSPMHYATAGQWQVQYPTRIPTLWERATDPDNRRAVHSFPQGGLIAWAQESNETLDLNDMHYDAQRVEQLAMLFPFDKTVNFCVNRQNSALLYAPDDLSLRVLLMPMRHP